MIHPRRPGEPGYLGPAAEAQRAAEILRAKMASPKRSRAPQADPATLALFSAAMEPTLF